MFEAISWLVEEEIMTDKLLDEIVNIAKQLSEDDQQRALNYLKNMRQRTSGADAIKIARDLAFDKQSLQEMEEAIKEARRNTRLEFPEVNLDE